MSAPTTVWLDRTIDPASAVDTVTEIEVASGKLSLLVDSDGGDYDSACAIGVALQNFSGDSEAIVLRGDSAAMIPIMACDRIVVAHDGSMLLHAVALRTPSLALQDLDGAADGLRAVERHLCDLFEYRSKSERATFFSYLMNLNNGAGTRLSAQDAINYGLADSISIWPASHFQDLRARRGTREASTRRNHPYPPAAVADVRRRYYERREERMAAAVQEAGTVYARGGMRARFARVL